MDTKKLLQIPSKFILAMLFMVSAGLAMSIGPVFIKDFSFREKIVVETAIPAAALLFAGSLMLLALWKWLGTEERQYLLVIEILITLPLTARNIHYIPEFLAKGDITSSFIITMAEMVACFPLAIEIRNLIKQGREDSNLRAEKKLTVKTGEKFRQVMIKSTNYYIYTLERVKDRSKGSGYVLKARKRVEVATQQLAFFLTETPDDTNADYRGVSMEGKIWAVNDIKKRADQLITEHSYRSTGALR
ncbi:MAG: hypothetical protein ACFFD4_22785 [Candidatus Odinarchaeota archaeon]